MATIIRDLAIIYQLQSLCMFERLISSLLSDQRLLSSVGEPDRKQERRLNSEEIESTMSTPSTAFQDGCGSTQILGMVVETLTQVEAKMMVDAIYCT